MNHSQPVILLLEYVTIVFMKEEFAGIIDLHVISMDCAVLLFEMEYVLMEV